jgi:Domain of unknown function (DUF5666)
MNHSTHSSALHTLRASIPLSRRHALLGLIAASLSLHGCGGGGETAGVGSGGTGSFSVGVISGFGSIIVNGIRFDDSQASILNDDGVRLSSSDLQIGMVVSVSGSSISNSAGINTAVANNINLGSELKGMVDSVAASSFVVLGQTVNVNASTIYAPGLAGLSALAAGNLVEVYGFTDPQTNTVVASRVERKASLNEYRLTGKVASLNTTARTFNIGSLTINYTNADLRVSLVEGLVVRVRLATSPSTGLRNAIRVQNAEFQPNTQGNFAEAEIHGTITAFTSLSQFSVNGIAVTTSAATSFPDGTAFVALGARVEVKGTIISGVMNAISVKLEDINDIEAIENELNGVMSALNTTAKTFVVRNITVDYSSAAIEYRDGSVNDLANGRNLEVRGRIDGATGNLLPTRIKFKI